MPVNNALSELKEIFRKFETSGTEYCVIRNFPSSKNTLLSFELDILISKADNKKVAGLLKNLGFIQTFKGPLPGHAVFTRYYSKINRFITLDLHVGGLTQDGILYLSEEKLIRRKQKHNNYFIPDKADYINALILHSIIDKKYFKKEYKKIIRENKKVNFEKLLNSRPKLLLTAYIKYPLGLWHWFEINLVRVLKVVNPLHCGPLISLIGPDGSGKSTTIQKLQEVLLSTPFRNRVVYMGWRGSILPFINRLMKADQKIFSKKVGSSQVHSNKFIKTTRSIFISIIYFSELMLRYFIKILPSRKLGLLVITDRYFYDRLSLDTTLPKITKKALMRIIPKPTLCYCLMAKPSVLAKREKSLSLAELTKQHKLFNKFCKDENITTLRTSVAQDKLALKILTDFWGHVTIKG